MEKLFNQEEIRVELNRRLRTHTQADISRATGLFPTNVSAMVRGTPLNARMLKWLGYEKATGLYRKVK